jgi:hypothetical protein
MASSAVSFLLLLHEGRPWYQQKLICTAVQSVGISRASIVGVTQTTVDQEWGYKYIHKQPLFALSLALAAKRD